MARGNNASTGRTARSEVRQGVYSSFGLAKGLKTIGDAGLDVPFIGDDGRISPTAIKEGVLSIRESTKEGRGGIGFKDIMSDIERDAGASGKLTAAGIITDSVELAYLRKAQEQREAETPAEDIINGTASSARAMRQYDKDIADTELRISEGLDELSKASAAGGKWAKTLPNEVARALNSIGSGTAGEKKLSKYDTKGVRKMLNDIYEELTK